MGQFFLALSLKDNISPGELLVAPENLVDESYPKLEAPGPSEDATEAASEELRNAAANRRMDEYTAERIRKGPRIGHGWCYHEAETRLKSRLFFWLVNEREKKFIDSYPYLDANSFSFIDFHKSCEYLFKAERDYTVESIKLYNIAFRQEQESFFSFYARLSAQTALCNWPIEQENLTLKDLFIGCIRDIDVQRQLIKPKVNLEDTLQLALESKKRQNLGNNFKTPYGSSKKLHPR